MQVGCAYFTMALWPSAAASRAQGTCSVAASPRRISSWHCMPCETGDAHHLVVSPAVALCRQRSELAKPLVDVTGGNELRALSTLITADGLSPLHSAGDMCGQSDLICRGE